MKRLGERLAAERATKCVTVKKTGRRYELFRPGDNATFSTATNAEDACRSAWSYARYVLGNTAIGYAGSVITVGFSPPE